MNRLVALLVALLLVGGGATAVPVAADAGPAKASKAKKAKKAKKKKKRKKRSGPARQGQPGPQGPAGPAGPPGTSIVARARLVAPMAITSNEGMTNVPLTGASWTQQADETDDFVGEATMRLPAECTASGPGPTDNPIWWLEDQVYGFEYIGGAWGELKLGKETLGYVDFPVWPEQAGKTVTRSFYIDRKLMEPGTPTARGLTVEFGKYCEEEGQDFQLESLKINVVGIR